MNELRDVILSVGALQKGKFVFAGGEAANNHLDLDVLHDYRREEEFIIHKLSQLVRSLHPWVLVPIPEGGNEWAHKVAEEIKAPVCSLKEVDRQPGLRVYKFADSWSQARAERRQRFVIIDDVGTKLTSLKGVLKMPLIREKAIGFAGIWLRGNPEVKKEVHIPTKWLVEEEIPAQLPNDSPYFRQSML